MGASRGSEAFLQAVSDRSLRRIHDDLLKEIAEERALLENLHREVDLVMKVAKDRDIRL